MTKRDTIFMRCVLQAFLQNKMKEKNKKKNKGIHWYKLGGRLLDYENNIMDKIDAIEFVRQWNLCYLWFSTAFLTSSVLK